jgi:hypothetical protein
MSCLRCGAFSTPSWRRSESWTPTSGAWYENLKGLVAYSPALARSHQSEINAALRAVRDLRAEIMPTLLALRWAIVKLRDEADLLVAPNRRSIK